LQPATNNHLCDKVCQWLAAGRWYSAGTLVSSTYKTYCHDITEILLKVALSAIILTPWKWIDTEKDDIIDKVGRLALQPATNNHALQKIAHLEMLKVVFYEQGVWHSLYKWHTIRTSWRELQGIKSATCTTPMTTFCFKGPSWSYGSWIYNYLCNQCLSSLKLWVGIPLRRCVLDTTLCDKVCQWLAAGRWYSAGTLVSSTYKTYCHDITEILLKVALSGNYRMNTTTMAI
jgi:predicted Rdx family selenoprotein